MLVWFSLHIQTEFLQNLEKAIVNYSSQGVTIKFAKDPFALVLVWAMIARTRECEFSKNILFIDSTSCFDSENYSITFLLTATSIGAVPCDIFNTKKQSKDAFLDGFKLYRNVISSLGG